MSLAKKETLIELSEYARAVEAEFVRDLSPAERDASGAPDAWAAKDILAHVTSWRRRGVEWIRGAERGELPEDIQEFEEANQKIFLENRGLSWDEALAQSADVWDAFLTALSNLPEVLLSPPEPPPAEAGPPLWRRLTIDAGNHPVLHFAEHASRNARSETAARWVEGLTPTLLALDGSADWHGVVHYNLACHYALAGRGDDSLDRLAIAFRLRPSLKDWAPQDSDLKTLHEDPRFKALAGIHP